MLLVYTLKNKITNCKLLYKTISKSIQNIKTSVIKQQNYIYFLVYSRRKNKTIYVNTPAIM